MAIIWENELAKITTQDENHSSGNNHTMEEYTDKLGKVILKRTYNSGERHDTYYVYDDFGNLTYVIPPLVDTTGTIDETVLENLCYQYVYDRRNRLVEKQLPGKKREYIVYNNLDQPILAQDAIQRQNSEWLFTQYDVFGRVAYTGKAVITGDRQSVQDAITALSESHILWTTRTVDANTTNNIGGKDIHYTTEGYPEVSDITEVLTVNYYDNYEFNTANEPALPSLVFNVALDNRTRGLATGSLVKVLTTNDWITTITRYDAKSRAIYSYRENEYLGTVDLVESELDFVGRPLKVRSAHTRNNVTVATLDNFAYDHVGRLLKQTQCIGNANLGYDCNGTIVEPHLVLENETITSDKEAPSSITIKATSTLSGEFTVRTNSALGGTGGEEELIVYNDYDELGQLKAKKVGGTPDVSYMDTDGLQTIDYRYNIRGWLTDINDVSNTTPDKLFNFGITYNGGTNPLYNGNIARTQWRTNNDDKNLKQYDYTYDALNRITGAMDNTGNYNLSNISYDSNGNMLSLTRGGHVVEAPTLGVDLNADGQDDHFGPMDVLDYEYVDGNQLNKVRDDGNDVYGFRDSALDNQDYAYDDNGNIIMDLNKGIAAGGITYNHLNLPTSVNLNSGTITYIYDATGTKLKKVALENAIPTVTEYAGNFVYSGDNGFTELHFFNQPEGYIIPSGAEGQYDYVYQYKDHLGNVRLSFVDNNGTTEIVEENNYYPFGLEHKGYNNQINGVENNYMTYGGKELDESLGLNWLDYGARNYDPALGRWMNIDPLAEKYYDFSGYNYTMNNPVLFTDPDGMRVEWGEGLDAEEKQILGYLIYQLRKNSKSFDKAFEKLHSSESVYKVTNNWNPDAEFEPNKGNFNMEEDFDFETGESTEILVYEEVADKGGEIRIPFTWADEFPSLGIDKTQKAKQTIVEEFIHAVQWETLFPSSGKTTLDFYLDLAGVANTEFEAKAVTGIIHKEVGWNVLTGGDKMAAKSGNHFSRYGFNMNRYNRDANRWISSSKTNPGYKERPLMNNVLPTVLINVLKSKKE